jgi:hypothetical protein
VSFAETVPFAVQFQKSLRFCALEFFGQTVGDLCGMPLSTFAASGRAAIRYLPVTCY